MLKLLDLKYLLVLLVVIFGLSASAQQFSKMDVLSDLDYLKSSLEETHFNLYAYTSKSEFEENYIDIKNQINTDSFSLLEVTNLFQQVVSKVNNAHTRIFFPIQSYLNYAESGGTIFPLEVAIENGRTLVRKNWSGNSEIEIGAELKSINGIAIDQILKKIYRQISAERQYFKNAQLEMFTLPRYYWQVFGEEKTFKIQVLQNGSLSTYQLKAIKAIEEYEMKRDDILKRNRVFKYLTNSTAYLQPGDFSSDEGKYQSFIDSVFNEIKAENLIIDIRNNSGGNDNFSDYLVSYFADQPFKWTSKFQLKSSSILKEDIRKTKDTTQAYWKSILDHKNGETFEYDFGYYEPQPKTKRYQGKVYVLVNRQSYSQSTVTASQVQDYGFAEIVGEETAEYPNLYASIFTYQLPKTGINVDVSKGTIQRINGIDDGKGVIPTILIKDHLLDEKDEILEELVRMISAE